MNKEASKEWVVYLPLAGIAGISGDSLKIGHARLQYMNSVEMDALYGKVDSILMASSAPSEKAKEANAAFIQHRAATLKGTVCAVFQITAEPEKAKEIAEEQTQDVLDLLSYFISFIHSRDYKGAVRLQGEMAGGHRTTLLISSDTDRLYQANERTGTYMPIEFTAEDIESMKKLGIFDVSAILERGQPTPFQKTILEGIRWFAASQRQDVLDIEFVNLVTCLENCLTPNDSSSINASVAEGCALLLADDLEPRGELRAHVREIYSIRSGIVHRGKRITRERDKLCLDHLRAFARNLLLVLIKEHINDFKSKENLLDWLTEQKLARKSNAIK
jgi:Apea-like HEPN